ncbi:MAG TPA: ubiquinol-cytochrome c reductase iron-sulfur subunit [bacterium]|jgi:cytochrome b6-f complex iron-sulfur subunit|nr:ubiquinol-cytochrome c reductase iron-sulfur subunit [bacterium]
MISSRVQRYFFPLLSLAFFGLSEKPVFADDAPLSAPASAASTIITGGVALAVLLFAYVAFLTAGFLLKTFKEYRQAKKEAGTHGHDETKPAGQTAFSLAFFIGTFFAATAVAVLFFAYLFATAGIDMSSSKAIVEMVITSAVSAFALMVLYLLYLSVMVLFRRKAGVHGEMPALAPGELPPGSGVTRRSFLSLLGWAWVAFTAASLGALSTMLRFAFPNVTFEPPLKFMAGFPVTYNPGVDERFKDAHRVWIVRNDQGFYALSTICTHLGCTPNWLQAEQKFKCPCHGSGYYITGVNFEGPAPRPLPRFNITLADDGQIQIDESIQYQQELGQWGLPGSFLNYKG